MLKKIVFRIIKKIAELAISWVYSFIDTDKDGLISLKEIKDFNKKISKLLKGGKRK